jgi:beta-lactamase superfamily II metal-dependent hydrolase
MIVFLILALALFAPASSMAQTTPALDIYVIDVEGGNATLFVSPSHESLLMDTGNVGAVAAPRDAGRIVDAMRAAGIDHIDHLITTHWHGDHFGGMAELAARVPIKEFIDHGANAQPAEVPDTFIRDTYPKLYANAKHTVAKAGDRIAMAGLDVRVVTSNGETIKTPLPGAGKSNPYCGLYKAGDNNAEDPKSIGVHVAFGKFRTAHFGDITKNIEFSLMCPNNRIGTVDALLGLHHGQASSNSEVLVYALHPRVAIMNDGTRKGGEPETMRIVHSSPGLEDLWELHFSLLSGQEYSVPGMFIANIADDSPQAMPIAPIPAPAPGPGTPPPPVHNGTAYWIKLSAHQDGSFSVTNARNGFTKNYKPGD